MGGDIVVLLAKKNNSLQLNQVLEKIIHELKKTHRIKSITFDGLDLYIAAKSKFNKNRLTPRLISALRSRKR